MTRTSGTASGAGVRSNTIASATRGTLAGKEPQAPFAESLHQASEAQAPEMKEAGRARRSSARASFVPLLDPPAVLSLPVFLTGPAPLPDSPSLALPPVALPSSVSSSLTAMGPIHSSPVPDVASPLLCAISAMPSLPAVDVMPSAAAFAGLGKTDPKAVSTSGPRQDTGESHIQPTAGRTPLLNTRDLTVPSISDQNLERLAREYLRGADNPEAIRLAEVMPSSPFANVTGNKVPTPGEEAGPDNAVLLSPLSLSPSPDSSVPPAVPLVPGVVRAPSGMIASLPVSAETPLILPAGGSAMAATPTAIASAASTPTATTKNPKVEPANAGPGQRFEARPLTVKTDSRPSGWFDQNNRARTQPGDSLQRLTGTSASAVTGDASRPASALSPGVYVPGVHENPATCLPPQPGTTSETVHPSSGTQFGNAPTGKEKNSSDGSRTSGLSAATLTPSSGSAPGGIPDVSAQPTLKGQVTIVPVSETLTAVGSGIRSAVSPGSDSRVPQAVLDTTPLPAATGADGSVHAAQILKNSGSSELRLNLNTNVFGRIEMHTVVHDNQVGLSLSSERGDLRGALGSETVQLDATLRQHDLRLHDIRFVDHDTTSALNSGESQNRGSQEQMRPSTPGREPGVARSSETERSVVSGMDAGVYRAGGLSLHV